MNGSRIAAVGHYQPAKVLTNEELAGLVDTSDEWIRSRVGIKTRHIMRPRRAGRRARLARRRQGAGLGRARPRRHRPGPGRHLDRRRPVPEHGRPGRGPARHPLASTAMDVNVVCAGFTHALATADHTVRAGAATRALVIGADKMSAVTDWSDRTTCVLVGDGAGAAVVEGTDVPGISPVLWGSVPEMGHAVRIEGELGRGSRRKGRASTAGRPPSFRRWPGRPASVRGSPPRTSPRSCCTRRTCGSSSRSRRRSAR